MLGELFIGTFDRLVDKKNSNIELCIEELFWNAKQQTMMNEIKKNNLDQTDLLKMIKEGRKSFMLKIIRIARKNGSFNVFTNNTHTECR